MSSRGGGWGNNDEQPRRWMGQQRPAEEVDEARTMRRKRSPVGKPHLFLSVEPSSLAGRALRAKPEGVGSGPRAPPHSPRSSLLRRGVGSAHGHRHIRHAQAFSAKGWGPLTGTAKYVTLKAFAALAGRRVGALKLTGKVPRARLAQGGKPSWIVSTGSTRPSGHAIVAASQNAPVRSSRSLRCSKTRTWRR